MASGPEDEIPQGVLPDCVLQAARYVRDWFPETAVFVGGVAVAAHAVASRDWKELARYTHDLDVFISRVDLVDLAEWETVIPNRRLSKTQFVKFGVEVGVYVQGVSTLAVPYEDLVVWSERKSGLRVACLEHLLCLKAHAWLERRSSDKGEKDARDLAAILILASRYGLRRELLAAMPPLALSSLPALATPRALQPLLGGNAHGAARTAAEIQPLLARLAEDADRIDPLSSAGFPPRS